VPYPPWSDQTVPEPGQAETETVGLHGFMQKNYLSKWSFNGHLTMKNCGCLHVGVYMFLPSEVVMKFHEKLGIELKRMLFTGDSPDNMWTMQQRFPPLVFG